MEALSLLESKISSLLELVKKLKTENYSLKKECGQLTAEISQLTEEKAKLSDDNAALSKNIEILTTKTKEVKESMLENDKSLDVLNQEKAETKLFIDDLIKDIDSLVESENQQ